MSESTSKPTQPGEPIIGREYYDDSAYFEGSLDLFADMDSPFQQYRIAKVLDIYTPGPDERVVDLGCGWGTFSFAIAPLCRDVTGVDFSRKAIAICNRLLEERGLDNVQFVCASAQDTGLPPGAYDTIICADLVEHLYPADTQALYDECWRLLKPGGKLIIWTPHRGHIFEILKAHNIILKRPVSHVDYKSMRRLVNGLRAKGFAIERNYYAESHVAVMRSIERALMAVVPPLRRRIAVLASKVGASGG